MEGTEGALPARSSAVVLLGARHVAVTERETPHVEIATDAVVRVEVSAVCGSDLHVWSGREACAVGTVCGHECVGTVVARGSAVRALELGTKVIVSFSVACGACYLCSAALSSRCQHAAVLGWRDPSSGAGLHGAQAEYIRIPFAEGTLYPMPPTLDLETALLVGDVAATAVFAAAQAGLAAMQNRNCIAGADAVNDILQLCSLREHERHVASKNPDSLQVTVIIGCGPVGLLAVAMSRCLYVLQGASADAQLPVFALDSASHRLRRAKEWGAHVFDVSAADMASIRAAVSRVSLEQGRSGRGADAVLECVGASSALQSAFELLAPGGVISSIGVNTDAVFPVSPAAMYNKNLTFRCGRCPARSLLPATLFLAEFARDKLGINIRDVFTHRMDLAEAQRAYEIFEQRLDGCIKIALYPETSEHRPL